MTRGEKSHLQPDWAKRGKDSLALNRARLGLGQETLREP